MATLLRCCATLLLGLAPVTVARASLPPTAGTITETLSIRFLTPSLGWRVTDRWNPDSGARGPLILGRTVNGGVRWQRVSALTGASSGTGSSFNVYSSRILFADPRNGWLYGNRLYATHDGGHSWRRLTVHGSQTALSVVGPSVWRLDSSCNVAANQCRFTLLMSTVGSDTWRAMSWRPPTSLPLGALLARSDTRHAWLTGAYTHAQRMLLRLFGTDDGGKSWHGLPMPCSQGGAGSMDAQLVPYTATQLWIFCASQPAAGSQEKSVFRSADGGNTWRMVADSGGFGMDSHGLHNLTISGYLNNAAVTSSSDAWIALSRGTLMHTADGGRTWHPAIPYQLANPGDGGVGPVQFADARHGWLFSFPDLLFRTVDGGQHWQKIDLR